MNDSINGTTSIPIPEVVTVRDLADLMEASPIAVIKQLMANGVIANINQQIDYETAAIVAAEMGHVVTPAVAEDDASDDAISDVPAWRKLIEEEAAGDLVVRPPVVAILGHVDHGKTSLLDVIRSTDIAEGESGGITQHIGAYQIEREGRRISFLDTPGHEAFAAMRARGAQVTDIVILVVAADDGVMPQTREAIAHAQAAGVPIVVALNKMDRAGANPELVKQQLADEGLITDEWDGDTMVIPVSATEMSGIDDLLEAIVLVTDETMIQANPAASGAGTVIEARIDKSRGVIATLLVQNGTLVTGDVIVAGPAFGRVRAMFDQDGTSIQEAPPSFPVEVMGLDSVPAAGDMFGSFETLKSARKQVDENRVVREALKHSQNSFDLQDVFARFESDGVQELNLVVKADVQGSIEPVISSLERLGGDGIKVRLLHSQTGDISESDVLLAAASGAIVIGFNVRADSAARSLASVEGVSIRQYEVIYRMVEDVEKALTGLLEPELHEKILGEAEVRAVFKISKIGLIAGCYMRDGDFQRKARARVLRGDDVVHDGAVSSLKHEKEDVNQVRKGFECGIGLKGFHDFKVGDTLQCYISEEE